MDLEHTVAGLPVLRRLAEGERSTIWLIEGDRVLKALRPPVAHGALAHEAEALARAGGDHVAPLLDVSAGDDGVALVFPRLPRGSLAALLRIRDGLDAGEAVTILVPVARALARMHAAGVAHGNLSAGDVLFRADGAPVVCGLGQAHLFPPGAPEAVRDREPGVMADREALARMAEAVLARVTGTRTAAAQALAGAIVADPGADLEERLIRGLFDLAAARPVVFDRPAEPAGPPRRLGEPAGVTVDASVQPGDDGPAGLRGMAVALLAHGPRALIRILRPRVQRIWAAVPQRRRTLLLGGAAGIAALLVLAAVIPGPGASDDAAESNPLPEIDDNGPADLEGSATAGPDAVDGAAGDDTAGDDAAVREPIDALPILLDRRTECFRSMSVLCLDGVVERGSAAERADRAALDALIGSGIMPAAMSAAGARVVERLGGTALIELASDSEPASVLLMRTEAGWRIRDYLPALERATVQMPRLAEKSPLSSRSFTAVRKRAASAPSTMR